MRLTRRPSASEQRPQNMSYETPASPGGRACTMLRPAVGVLLVVLAACSQGDNGESSAPAPETTAASTSTSTTVPDGGEAEVDQLIDDIAEGYDRFTTGSDDIRTTLMGWAAASGTYQRVAEELNTQPPDPLPDHVVRELANALNTAADALMSAIECAAEGLEAGSGPEVCAEAFSEASTTSTMIAVRLEPVIGYGSRPYDEVLALFSS